MFELEEVVNQGARLKVIGIGGGGCNAVDTMIASGLQGVEFIAVNTDAQVLARSRAPVRLQIGARLTKGLGVGAHPDRGREAAMEDLDRIREVIGNPDMVFITAGMGGGTGTGAAPVIAGVAREAGALTVAVVTRPFQWEGFRRMENAEQGIEALKRSADTVIVIPNQRLLELVDQKTSLTESFQVANQVLHRAVQGISDLITRTGLVNVDFADVRTIMSHMGKAVMGMGSASGEGRTVGATQQAISSPLLEDGSIEGARGVLINISGGPGLTLHEVSEASALIHSMADPKANIIFGCVIDEALTDEVVVTVIATGFEAAQPEALPEKRLEEDLAQASPEARSRILDRPTFLRRLGREDYRNEALGIDGEEWDVPTFLRKRGKEASP